MTNPVTVFPPMTLAAVIDSAAKLLELIERHAQGYTLSKRNGAGSPAADESDNKEDHPGASIVCMRELQRILWDLKSSAPDCTLRCRPSFDIPDHGPRIFQGLDLVSVNDNPFENARQRILKVLVGIRKLYPDFFADILTPERIKSLGEEVGVEGRTPLLI